MDKINHKQTIQYLNFIFIKSKKSKLDFESSEGIDEAFRYLSSIFNLSHIQCALLSIIFSFTIDEDLERVRTQRLLSFLDMELEDYFDLTGDLELLIKKGFIRQKNEDRTNNLYNSSFTINQALLDMLLRNETIEFEKLYGNGYNFVQFSGHMYRINKYKLLNHQSKVDIFNSIESNEDRNANLTQIQTLKSFNLDVKDRFAMYYLIHKQSDLESKVSTYSLSFDVYGIANAASFIKQLSDNKSQLQILGLIEIVGKSNEVQLTSKAKELLLNEHCLTKNEEEVETSHYYIKHDTIQKKELFFNSEIQRELNILQTLLKKDNFKEYQQAMKLKGNKAEGISILLYGPSGTGKSSIADMLAKQSNRDIFQVDLSVVRSKWWGESEKNIKQIFEDYNAKCSKSDTIPILLLNECDALLGKRNHDGEDSHDMTESTMINLLLELFEKNSGIIIAITNLVEQLDNAFMRRFTMKYFIGNPDKKAVKSILKSKIDFLDEGEIERIADRHLLTGGQIENVSMKCVISKIITKSNPTVSEIMDYCENEKIKTNLWKEVF
ncbi:MAG: ATP-binding protein [Paludibacter sp.]|nr:ATP-binding protein [Paludibacter sp.]